MTEREKVLLQREAVRKFIRSGPGVSMGFLSEAGEKRVRQLFPLPPRREPRVVRVGGDGVTELRQNLGTGRIELRVRGASRGWERQWSDEYEDAIRQVLASPYIEVPDPEDAP